MVGSARTGRVLDAGFSRDDRSSDSNNTRGSWLLDIVSHRNKIVDVIKSERWEVNAVMADRQMTWRIAIQQKRLRG